MFTDGIGINLLTVYSDLKPFLEKLIPADSREISDFF